MNKSETPELFLSQLFNSTKIKRLAVILLSIGICVCFILLLIPVQNAIISFVVERHSGSGDFEVKLRSILSLPFVGIVLFILAFCCLFSGNIAEFLENPKNTLLIKISAAGICVLLQAFISIFSYKNGWKWLDSDQASEMVLGRLLANENTFVSRNWHYSTEIRLIYQTLFTMPLFKLLGRFENWALIRSISIFLNNLLLILSYQYMARQLKIPVKWIYITSIFLVIPLSWIEGEQTRISAQYWDIVLYGGYYTFFIAQFFFCIGIFIKLKNHDGEIKTALPGFIIFTVLSLLLGMQSVRSLLNIHIPLLITCIYLYMKNAQRKKSLLVLGSIGFIACCAGFFINYLLRFWYSFSTFEGVSISISSNELFSKLSQNLTALAQFFGFYTGGSLLSAQGLFSFFAIIFTCLIFAAVLKTFRQPQTEHHFIPVFFAISVIFNIFTFILIGNFTTRYFIPFMVFYVPFVAILLEHSEKRNNHLKRTAIFSGIILFIFSQGYFNYQKINECDFNTIRKGYIQYLLDNKLEYGFATFWNANVTTELTGGKIELAGLNPDTSRFHIQVWLNPVKFYNPSYNKGESFLLLTRHEWELARKTGRAFTHLQPDYEDNDFIIIRYESTEIIHRDVLE